MQSWNSPETVLNLILTSQIATYQPKRIQIWDRTKFYKIWLLLCHSHIRVYIEAQLKLISKVLLDLHLIKTFNLPCFVVLFLYYFSLLLYYYYFITFYYFFIPFLLLFFTFSLLLALISGVTFGFWGPKWAIFGVGWG